LPPTTIFNKQNAKKKFTNVRRFGEKVTKYLEVDALNFFFLLPKEVPGPMPI
jgi:hypothetical protein